MNYNCNVSSDRKKDCRQHLHSMLPDIFPSARPAESQSVCKRSLSFLSLPPNPEIRQKTYSQICPLVVRFLSMQIPRSGSLRFPHPPFVLNLLSTFLSANVPDNNKLLVSNALCPTIGSF